MRIFKFFIFLSVILFSQELSPQPLTPQSKIRLGGELNLGIDYYQYKEPDVMDITGPMFSLEGSFSFAYKLLKVQLDGYFSTHMGANEYSGGLYNSATKETIAYNTQSQDWYLGVASRVGMAFVVSQREVAYIYTGFGYRFLHNMMIDKPNIKASYERDQGYLYFLLGVDGEIPINKLFSILAEFQYRQLMYGHQMSGMKELGYDEDFYFTQTEGFGGRVSVGGKFYFHNQIALKLRLYFDFWSIEQSNLVAGYQGGKFISNFIEPRNYTRAFGVSAGVSF